MSELAPERNAVLPPNDQPFAAAWLTERMAVERALDGIPESDAAVREALLDRAITLERLILDTRAQCPAGIRAKAYVLRRLMEMTQAEELPAMRDIEAFLDACA